MKIKKSNLNSAHQSLLQLLDVNNTQFSEKVLDCVVSVEAELEKVRIESTPTMTDELKAYQEQVGVIRQQFTPKEGEEVGKEGFNKAIEALNKEHSEAFNQIKTHEEAFLKTLENLVEVKPLIGFTRGVTLPKNLTAKNLIAVNTYMSKQEKEIVLKPVK